MRDRFSRGERSWVLYDVANSAYSLAVTTAVFPLFFKTEIAAGVPGATSTAWLAFANSLFTLVVAVLATGLGPMGDYEGRKKRFFASFFVLGVTATGAIAFAVTGRPLAALALYVVSGIGFAGANVFYDAFLTRREPAGAHGPGVLRRLRLGYVGGSLPFVVAMAVMMGLPQLGLSIEGWGSTDRVPDRGAVVAGVHGADAPARAAGPLPARSRARRHRRLPRRDRSSGERGAGRSAATAR